MFKELSFGLALGDGGIGSLEGISEASVGAGSGSCLEFFLGMKLAGLVHAVNQLLPLLD